MKLGFKLYFNNGDVLYLSEDMLTRTGDGVYAGRVRDIDYKWTVTPFDGGRFIGLEVQSEKPLNIKRMDSVVFCIGKLDKTMRFGMFTGNMYSGETRFADEVGIDREYCGDGIGVYSDLTAPALTLAGVSPFECAFGAGEITRLSGDVELFAKTEFTVAQSMDKRLKAERVIMCDSVTCDGFYDIYRALLPQSSFEMPKLTGWNTWDYYLDRVTPEDIAENVAALAKMPFSDKLGYIVIDDGWQKEWGIWRENDKFACGLGAVAEDIIAAGFKAGIWMAPLSAKKSGTLAATHPEWFCKNEDGSFYESMGLIYLDPTNPEAEQFILDNYRYQYNAGYRLFKIDYLSPLVNVRVFYDKNATGYSALRTLMKRVVEATGDDTVILGCSLPVQCGADIAPSMRIGVDIHNHWDHVYWIAESLKYTWMYNKKVTRIDPDFMVVRGEQTSTEPLVWEGRYNGFVPPHRAIESSGETFKRHWRHGDQFSAIEAQTWADLVAVCGGNIFLSDRMSKLNDLGVEIISNALEIAAELGRPRHLADDVRRPSVWESERSMVVINWEDEARTITVPNVTHGLVSKKPFTLKDGTLTVTLEPHASFSAVYE